MSWRKLDKIDRENIYLAKSNAHLAIQLVSVAGRSYLEEDEEDKNSVLKWNENTRSFDSLHFGDKKNIQLALDLVNFKLNILVEEIVFESSSLEGKKFGDIAEWIRAKLAVLQLNPGLYAYNLPYQLDTGKLTPDIQFEKLNKKGYQELAVYYHNAHYILKRFKGDRLKKKDKIYTWPQHFSMNISHQIDENSKTISGFSPGDNHFPEPYFYVTTLPFMAKNLIKDYKPIVGKWHTETWTGLVLTASEIIKEKDELEEHITFDFLNNAFEITQKVLA